MAMVMMLAFCMPAMASEPEPTIVANAATQGAYMYNVETQEQSFVSASSYARTSSSRSMPQYIPSSAVADSKVVTPPDSRTKVSSPSGRYSNTVLLIVKFEGQAEIAVSGWMIGPKTVATAGHCVYKYGKGWAESITVYPGASGGNYPFGSASAINMWAGGDYMANDGNYAVGVYDDWGVIELDSNLGNQTGWLGLVAAENYSSVAGATFQTNGYPADLENANVSTGNEWMYTCYGSFTGSKPRFLPTMYINIDFAGGQSGSPIYRNFSDTGYSAQAIGVAGDNQTIAVLINNWLFDFYMSVR